MAESEDKNEQQETKKAETSLVGEAMKSGVKTTIPLVVMRFYEDAISEAAKLGGKALANYFRQTFSNLLEFEASSPQRLAALLERLSKLVPEERLIDPHPQIALPILQNLIFMADGDILTEMFLNLLARAMDEERVEEAHPGFVKIIEQLSPDEAMLLIHLRKRHSLDKRYQRGRPVRLTINPGTDSSREIDTRMGLDVTIANPKNYSLYIEHLSSLDLIEPEKAMGARDLQLKDVDPDLRSDLAGQAIADNFERIIKHLKEQKEGTGSMRATQFGKLFIKACLPEDFDLSDWKKSKSTAVL